MFEPSLKMFLSRYFLLLWKCKKAVMFTWSMA